MKPVVVVATVADALSLSHPIPRKNNGPHPRFWRLVWTGMQCMAALRFFVRQTGGWGGSWHHPHHQCRHSRRMSSGVEAFPGLGATRRRYPPPSSSSPTASNVPAWYTSWDQRKGPRRHVFGEMTVSTRAPLEQQQQPQQHHLVIVESPAKCATIEAILNAAHAITTTTTTNDTNNNDNNNGGNGGSPRIHYTVMSCMGHIRNLPKKAMGTEKRAPPRTQQQQRTPPAATTDTVEGGNDTASMVAKPVATTTTTTTDHSFAATSTKPYYAVAGIDWDGGRYAPQYTILDSKLGVVRDLQHQVARSDQVLLATDPDREGEAMAWHLSVVLDLVPAGAVGENSSFSSSSSSSSSTTTTAPASSSRSKPTPYHRIRFSEITTHAIVSAVQRTMTNRGPDTEHDSTSPPSTSTNHHHHRYASDLYSTTINDKLVAAQETRRVLDRLAGYTVSPVLWKKIAPGLSAGRVQSVGLQLIVQRELLRLAFESTAYYDITAHVQVPLSHADHRTTGTRSSGTSARQALSARLVSINTTAVANAGRDFTAQGRSLTAASAHKYHLATESDAAHWIDRIAITSSGTSTNVRWSVDSIASTKRTTQAPRPYKTSTLQQDAVQRLGLPVQQTMRAAQQLYEAGCISYMRTDSTVLSQESQGVVEAEIISTYGAHCLSGAAPVKSKDKDKYAQEAHEAIRPAVQGTGKFLKPDELPTSIASNPAAAAVYKMIYQRTLAHRMPPLISNQTQVVILADSNSGETQLKFKISGSVVVSPGYTMVYETKEVEAGESGDDSEHLNSSQVLPPLYEGQIVQLLDMFPVGHETQPPQRFTEASFVKELEALGVGRPSTYAGIVQILRDRAYVGSPAINSDKASRSKGRRKEPTGPAISAFRAAGGDEFAGGGSGRGPLVPSLSAIVVCALLKEHCPTYTDPSFTSRMEDQLDKIAFGDSEGDLTGEEQRFAYLDEFYAGENGLAARIKRIEDTVDSSEARRAVLPALLETNGDENSDNKTQVGLFIGPWGPYMQQIGTMNEVNEKPPTAPLPPSMAADISTINPSTLRALLASKQDGGTLLGQHPDDARNIRVKIGRYGPYLQWGDEGEEGTTSHSLPRKKTRMRGLESSHDDDEPDSDATLSTLLGVTLEEAVAYVTLPRTVALLENIPIVAAIGPYGPYLKYNNKYMSLNEKHGDVLTIDGETAVTLVVDNIVNKVARLGRGVLSNLGEKEGSNVCIKSGKFGTYIAWGKINAKLPSEYEDTPETIPLDEAWVLIQANAPPVKEKATKKIKDKTTPGLPPRPKRPISAYLHFCAEKRPEIAETVKKLGDMSKQLASLWSETVSVDRQKYEQLAALGKMEYEEKIHAWENECLLLEPAPPAKRAAKSSKLQTMAKPNSRAVRKQIKSDTTDGPTKPRAPSAYILFCREFRVLMVDDSGTKLPMIEATKRLAHMWSECENKEKFHSLAALEKEKLLSPT